MVSLQVLSNVAVTTNPSYVEDAYRGATIGLLGGFLEITRDTSSYHVR